MVRSISAKISMWPVWPCAMTNARSTASEPLLVKWTTQSWPLGMRCGIHLGVGVTHRDAHIHAQQVDVALAVLVPQILHAAPAEDQRSLVGHESPLRRRVIGFAALHDALR